MSRVELLVLLGLIAVTGHGSLNRPMSHARQEMSVLGRQTD